MNGLIDVNRSFMQVCWVVPDLQEAMANWTQTTGVGPFFYFEEVPFEDGVYRGSPADAINISAAIAQAGEMQVELVQLHEDRPSFFHDVVPFGQTGLHHMGLYCENYDADVAAYRSAGFALAYHCKMMGARSCWFDTCAQLGFMIELVEKNPVADAVFGQFREASLGWDGSAPVRTLG